MTELRARVVKRGQPLIEGVRVWLEEEPHQPRRRPAGHLHPPLGAPVGAKDVDGDPHPVYELHLEDGRRFHVRAHDRTGADPGAGLQRGFRTVHFTPLEPEEEGGHHPLSHD
jgi:hypothetical protein